MPTSLPWARIAPSLRRARPTPGKVALVSGGGSGHEPLHAGFVGHGMLDAACPGQVFTSPTPDQMLAAAQAVDTGAGVLFIVKNYEGDVMNFDMAREMATGEVATVVTNDDVAVDNSTYSAGRRGVAGTLVVEKIVGAAAEEGRDLAALAALGERVNGATRSMGVALTSCTVPAAGQPTFEIGADEIEMGVGIHGEPGRRRRAMAPADTLAAEMIGAIAHELGEDPGEVLLLVNGFGGTPSMELYLMYHAARRLLESARIAGGPIAGRQLRDLARHGRLLAHRDPARSRTARAVGRPGTHARAPLGDVAPAPDHTGAPSSASPGAPSSASPARDSNEQISGWNRPRPRASILAMNAQQRGKIAMKHLAARLLAVVGVTLLLGACTGPGGSMMTHNASPASNVAGGDGGGGGGSGGGGY